MLEKEIERKVVNWSKDHGWITLKFKPENHRGFPDRIFISPFGKHVWIEFKAPGKRPTQLQHVRLRKLMEHRVNAVWFDSSEGAIAYLEELA